MKIMTGSGVDDWLELGVKMFRYKQSSENYAKPAVHRPGPFSSIDKLTVKGQRCFSIIHGGWGHAGALDVALSTRGAHGAADTGGFHLNKWMNLFFLAKNGTGVYSLPQFLDWWLSKRNTVENTSHFCLIAKYIAIFCMDNRRLISIPVVYETSHNSSNEKDKHPHLSEG